MLVVKEFGSRHSERSEGTAVRRKNADSSRSWARSLKWVGRERYPILIAVAGDWQATL
jgi:hypothetical protein